MSHTYQHGETLFVGNSDLSGEIEITDRRTGNHVSIRGDDILEFVADYVSREKIARLENCSAEQVLFGDMP